MRKYISKVKARPTPGVVLALAYCVPRTHAHVHTYIQAHAHTHTRALIHALVSHRLVGDLQGYHLSLIFHNCLSFFENKGRTSNKPALDSHRVLTNQT